MSDVVEGGRSPRGRRPMWWAVVAMGCVVAAVLATVKLSGGSGHHEAAPTPSALTPSALTPSPTPQPSPLGSPSPASSAPISPTPISSAGPWPSASAACGGSVYLPQLVAGDGPAQFSGALLVGGAALQQLTIAGGSTRAVSLLGTPTPGAPALVVTQLVAGPQAAYAQVADCETNGLASANYRISDGVATRLPLHGELALVGGVHHAWGVTYASPDTATSTGDSVSVTVMTPLDGGPKITLPPNTDLVADTTAGLVVDHYDPIDSNTLPVLEVLDPATGASRHPLVDGYPLGGNAEMVVIQSRECALSTSPTTLCSLAEVDVASRRTLRSVAMPTGRLPVSNLTFSADGTKAAFLLTRAQQDPRFATGHPIGPEDVAVLDVGTGQLSIVPGVELAPKTQVGLAFDYENRLLIAVSQGSHGDLLEWQVGAVRTQRVGTIPGPLAESPFLLLA